MSIAQIELMCADCSITVYPKTDTAKGANGKEYKFSRPSAQSLKEMQREFNSWDDAVRPHVDLSGFTFG